MKNKTSVFAPLTNIFVVLIVLAVSSGFPLAANAAPLPTVPTTKIIAIGTITPDATQEAIGKVLPQEVRETVQLHLDGKIEQWNVRNDRLGVVFVLNITNVEEARAIFAKMPLDRAGLISFEFIPVGPLSPLSLLLNTAPAN